MKVFGVYINREKVVWESQLDNIGYKEHDNVSCLVIADRRSKAKSLFYRESGIDCEYTDIRTIAMVIARPQYFEGVYFEENMDDYLKDIYGWFLCNLDGVIVEENQGNG